MKNDALDPAVAREVARQKEHLLRGTLNVFSEDGLETMLSASIQENRPLRVKLGVDPTSADLHFGHTVVLNKLRAFQEQGHQAVLIIGDATAMVGDPTGRNKTRPRLSHADILRNAEEYVAQASKVIDTDKAEIRHNSEWLHALDFEGLVTLSSRYTVARMLERKDFAGRYRSGTPIYVHEFLYPLLQGWDSVMVKADLEIGGDEQLFNLLVGRDLQQQEGQPPQVCLTTPLLVGLDGELKMSKSYGNSVGISESPDEMFTKIMRIDDAMMGDWFTLLTEVPADEVAALLADQTNPRDIKFQLARDLVSRYHGEDAGNLAQETWQRVVSRKEIPEDVAVVDVSGCTDPDGGFPILDLLMASFPDLKSRGEARRLIKGGGVTIDGDKVLDPLAITAATDGQVLRAGKRRVARLKL